MAVVLTAAAGGLIALQAPINSTLGRSVGTFQGAFVSFIVGTIALAIVAGLSRGGMGQLGEIRGLPWYYLIGGLLGAVYVSTVLVTVRHLGAGGVTAATIAGQLTLAVVVDQFGWLGVDRHTISLARALGILLLVAGVVLVVRD
ncbi:MAG TPA: DMT family transporter [Solirubrobacteraceae bacterium]|nr:DMT family transporter [Solirubrobacteraceae bacterium]